MKLDLTKQNIFTNILYVVLLVIVLWGGWSQANVGFQTSALSLGGVIDNAFNEFHIAGFVVSSLLVLLNMFLVTRLCIKNAIFLEHSYVPAFVYVAVSAGFLNSCPSFRPLIVSTILLLITGQIFKSYNIKSLATGVYLNIGFYFGLIAVIYEPAALLFPLVIIGLMLFRFFDIREWIVAIVGFALPLFFAAYVNWLITGEFTEFYRQYIAVLLTPASDNLSLQNVTITEWVFCSVVILLILFSVVKTFTQRALSQAKIFKAHVFFVWFTLLVLAMLIYAPCRSLHMLPIVATPIAVVVSSYFNVRKPSFMTNLLYIILIGSTIVLHIVPVLVASLTK